VQQLPNQVRQAVGIFGWNDTTMPVTGYLLWFLLLVALVLLALRRGNWRERSVVLALPALIAVLDVFIAVGVQAQIGFGMQVRYLLPLAVGVPLVVADVVDRRLKVDPAIRARLAAVVIGGVALLHLVAWVSNARRYAVGTDGPWMPTQWGEWAPQGGWGVWIAVAAIGVVAILGGAVAMGVGAARGGYPRSRGTTHPRMKHSETGSAAPLGERY
jgi:hypothetical protein